MDTLAELRGAKADLEGMVEERTAALRQRDLLLREVYHRVKNNLQIIDGMVKMQARQFQDQAAKDSLQALRVRIYALGRGRPKDRKSVVSGKSVSVRVDIG